MNVLVSIILPVYNGRKFLKECIESVLNQTYNFFELIIIDDGSTDKSEEIVKEFNSEKIRYYFKDNEGVAATRSFGLSKAKGDIISFIDQDDMWNESYLVQVVEHMKEYDFIYANGRYLIDKNLGNNIYNDKQSELNKSDSSLSRLLRQNFIVSPTQVSVKSKVIHKVGMFDQTLDGSGADDWDYWIRIFSVDSIKVLFNEKPMITYRFHDNNNSFNREVMFKCKLGIISKHKELALNNVGAFRYRSNKAIVLLQYARYKISQKKMVDALVLIGRALILNPFVLVDKRVRTFLREEVEGS